MRSLALVALPLLLTISTAMPTPTAAQPEGPFDLLFVGGEVIDGTGAPRFHADMGIRGDRIAAIGDLRGAKAGQTVDVTGLVVTPGFIDPYTNFLTGEAMGITHENAVQQGITTTAISVEDGYVDKVQERQLIAVQGTAINLVQFFPVSTAYGDVVPDGNPTPAAIDELRRLARKAFEDGAFAVGAGMAYCPSCLAPTEVFIEVVKEAAPFGGYFSAHIRNEDRHVINATAELIAIAEGAGVPGVVHHMKVGGPPQCGQAVQTTGLVWDALQRGSDIAASAYPYMAGYTTDVALLVPDEYEQGTEVERQLRFRNPATRPEIVRAIEDVIANFTGTADRVYFPVHRTTLVQEADLRGVAPGEAVLQMVENKEVRPVILHFGCEEDLKTILTQPWTSVLTDGQPWAGPAETYVAGHPRTWGTYSAVLGTYARDEGWFTLEEAVRKMTGQPAYRLGLHYDSRGLIKEGWAADVVVFDPATVADQATYEQAGAASVGFEWVLVNGVALLRDGELAPLAERVAAPPGRLLLHTAEMRSEPQPGYDFRGQGRPGAEASADNDTVSAGVAAVLAALAVALMASRGRRGG